MAIDASTETSTESPSPLYHVRDPASLHAVLRDHPQDPVLVHVNADTTWLLLLPYPAGADCPAGRTRFNVLLDPWLQGPQSDVASWFSTQWHLVAPSVRTMGEVNNLLMKLELEELHRSGGIGEAAGERRAGQQQQTQGSTADRRGKSFIDVVALSHEFTDHCHEATLKELPPNTPVFAPEKASELVRSWRHFDTVITTPAFSSETKISQILGRSPLPPWMGIGRIVTVGNSLYYHSAILIVYASSNEQPQAVDPPSPRITSEIGSTAKAVIYSPHGIKGSDLVPVRTAGVETLALLHGLHDVRIWMTKQLNLGAINALEAVRAVGARYWVATHDEIKKGGGFISPLLRRTNYTLKDAVRKEEESRRSTREDATLPDYEFVELGSGDVLVLASS